MRFSIQSKMIVGFLSISITAAVITGYLGFRSGNQALTQSIYARMTALRASKSHHVTNYLKMMRLQVLTASESMMVIEAAKEFSNSSSQLRSKDLTDEQLEELQNHYLKVYFPELSRHIDARPVLESVMPRSGLAKYLQYHYIVRNPNGIGHRDEMIAADDDSEYSKIHGRFHEVMRNFKRNFQYKDIMIFDPDTSSLVYSASKEIDFGTSFETGPFSQTGLAKAIRRIQRERDKGMVSYVSFEPYRPSYGLPAAFMVSPVFDDMTMVGIVAIQFPIDRLSDIISGDNNWKSDGLGETGEVYLVGEDGYMRNESRFFKEDPRKYIQQLQAVGYGKDQISKTERFNTTVLTVKISNQTFREISLGRSNTAIMTNYLGKRVLSSYAPLDIEGIRWGIVAEITTDESFAPIRAFTHDLLSTLAGIGLVSSLLAAMLGTKFARPIRKLTQAAKQLGKGNYHVRVKLNSNDEFEDLGKTFNEMAAELESQSEKIQEKIQENERLLESMLPAPVAARLRTSPNEMLSDTHEDVTVIFAAVKGFDNFSESLEPVKALALLNRLIVSFDEAGERNGVEKLKSSGASYLAVCGLSIPRFDHSQRAVAFAMEIVKIVRVFNRENGAQLQLQIGIHRGPVTGGIIGRNKFIYDLWGKTINIAKNLGEGLGDGEIRISKDVFDRVADLYECKLISEKLSGDEPVYVVENSSETRAVSSKN